MTAGQSKIDAQIDAFLASFLAGAPVPAGALRSEAIVARARYHGLQGLLAENPHFAEAAPVATRALFRDAAADAISDVLRHELLGEICSAFAAAGVDMVLLKGAALAYLVYEKPALRPRLDTDIIVAPEQKGAARDVLAQLGFAASPVHVPHYQTTFTLERSGIPFPVDLHWRAANSDFLTQLYTFETLRAGAQPVTRLHPRAVAPSDEMLLSFAITHLLFDRDYRAGMRFIWLVDLRAIAARMDRAAWERFSLLQASIGGCGAAALALREAEVRLGRFVPETAMARLGAAPEGQLSRYLAASEFGRMRRDLLCRNRRQALTYLGGVLFPPRARLMEIYGPVPRWQAPLLYLHRAATGIVKAKRRSGR